MRKNDDERVRGGWCMKVVIGRWIVVDLVDDAREKSGARDNRDAVALRISGRGYNLES